MSPDRQVSRVSRRASPAAGLDTGNSSATTADPLTDASAEGEHSRRRARARSRRLGLVALHPRSEEGTPDSWRVSGATLVGRSREAGVRLSDDHISRRHAMVEPHSDGLLVRDLKSRHGTFVAGEIVGSDGALARPGEPVRVGNTLLLVTDDVERHRYPPRRFKGRDLGLSLDMVAGPALAEVWDQAVRLGALSDPVLILGETGSGKECVARLVHAGGGGKGSFVGINVAAIPEELFEAELFGYEKGAFTGASRARPGAFREASDGVLFLDEVGDLPRSLQAKLLRAIDLRRVRPLGATCDVPVTARVVSATNRDLGEACEEGRFRQDLAYRLSALVLKVPPLRERPEDIVLLALQTLRSRDSSIGLSGGAAEALALATWKGNARELVHALIRALDRAQAAGDTQIRREHLPDLGESGESLTPRRIRGALRESGGVVVRAAELLGVSRATLYNAFKRFRIDQNVLRER